ncbi:unnamed protein product [Zymoseptoria tritici ST99CH_3D7]|uniref:Uncharacterized protein n=1 Tax=Zymoseptoria tritici (strain ST99CH_3D7) TaxID=1276538 RepID=A0A1X7SA29_ZYMT9|nr:unnamed protein product [Zymoseptoria tritici ST99CH_3D7]
MGADTRYHSVCTLSSPFSGTPTIADREKRATSSAATPETLEHEIPPRHELPFKQVRTLKHGGKNEAEEDRKEVMSRLETISSEMEAIAKQIAIIEDQEWQTDENWERWKSWARRWMLLRPALEKPGKEMDHAGEAGQADGRCSDRLGRFWLR